MNLSNSEKKAKAVNDDWKRHTRIVRGGAVKKFSGLEFKEA